MPRPTPHPMTVIGPGIVIAATGVGAGDLIAASTAGASFGTAVLWAVLLGAILKFFLNEGIARWQLGSGTTLLEGWKRHLPAAGYLFFAFLLLWSFMVAGALINACALAAHTLVPSVPLPAWGILHSLAALALVWLGRYRGLERLMKAVIAAMFAVVVVCAVSLNPPPGPLASGLFIPRVPGGALPLILGLMGGIGGSLTVLCYAYWIREKGWRDPKMLRWVRLDLIVAYTLTAAFGVAMVVIASRTGVEGARDSRIILNLATLLQEQLGSWGRSLFLFGFWAAVFSSMLGVWNGVPYLFADFFRKADDPTPLDRTLAYRGFLLFLAIPPLLLLLVNRPVWIIILYAILGAFFMPFLAATLLWLNNRSALVGPLRNSWIQNLGLTLSLLLFSVLAVMEVLRRLGPGG